MTNEQQKALDLLHKYKEIKTRQATVERWQKHINDDLAVLFDQQARAEAEAKEIAEKLKTEFAEFEQADFINLKIEEIDEGHQDIKRELRNSQRINKETKDAIFKKIIESRIFGNGKRHFPVVAFETIRIDLKKLFSIDTDNLTQFFRDQFKKCKLFGGTRNRAVWVPVEMLDISESDYEELAKGMKHRLEDDETLNPKPWQ